MLCKRTTITYLHFATLKLLDISKGKDKQFYADYRIRAKPGRQKINRSELFSDQTGSVSGQYTYVNSEGNLIEVIFLMMVVLNTFCVMKCF